ncbi:MAG: anhydro-N-acetylmuramic acid kinase [Robiginitomaculum sp.]|nr:anhydro-N-acetylmuramic acid kinase [Robiginitomaculum sp.]
MYIAGLMSGTSLDGMDAAVLSIQPSLEPDGAMTCNAGFAGVSIAYSPARRKVLEQAVQAALTWKFIGPKPAVFTEAAKLVADMGAQAITQLQRQLDLQPSELRAVGFHGQTLLHQPPVGKALGQTLQIGDAKWLANQLGVPVVSDFRTQDMRSGGHGAPLAPAWHYEIARQGRGGAFAFVNIGGVSNITYVPNFDGPAGMIAFDCGPGNGPLDAWMQQHGLGTMDKNGTQASIGQINEGVVSQILATMPVVGQASSLDRWAFDANCVAGLSVPDGAATLVEITAQGIARGLAALPQKPAEIMVGGGGRHHPVLMERLKTLIGPGLIPCEAAGWDGDLIEAQAFAWAAYRRITGQANSWPGTTGCFQPTIGGVICDPDECF